MRYFLVFLGMFLAINVFAQQTYHVKTAETRVYDLPNTSSSIVAVLRRGQELEFIKEMTDPAWGQVRYGGQLCFIRTSDIQKGPYSKETKKAVSKKYHVKVFQTAVYKSADMRSGRIRTLRQGEEVEVIGESGDFFKTRESGGVGYVPYDHLAEGKAPKPKPTKENKVETYVVFHPKVDVHSSPNNSSSVTKVLKRDDYVEVISVIDGKWAKIQLDRGFGYINVIGLKKVEGGGSSGGGSGGGVNIKKIGTAKYPVKVGAVCRDGTLDYNMGRGICKDGGGVRMWIYKTPK